MPLTETQFPQAGAGQGGAGWQQHLHRFLAAGAAVEVDAGVLPLGGELDGVVLLQAQQVLAGDPQQQVIASLQPSIRQGGEQAFSATLKFQHVHVEAPLQTAVVQRATDQFRIPGNRHFRAVGTGLGIDGELVAVAAPIRQQHPRGEHEIESAGQPDRDADQREAEQFQGSVAELLADVAHQQVHGTAQQGQGAPQHGGEGQRQQHPRGREPPAVAPVLHHRQQRSHHGGVGHDAGHRRDHEGHQGDQTPWGPDPLGGDQSPQTIEGTAFEQSSGDGEQAQQGDQSRAPESRQGLLRVQNA